VFARGREGGWEYLGGSARLDAAGEWREATWTTPPIADGVTHLSFGIALDRVGTVDIDDAAIARVAAATPAGSGTARRVLLALAVVAFVPSLLFIGGRRLRRFSRRHRGTGSAGTC